MGDAVVDQAQSARSARLADSLATLRALYPGQIRGRLADLIRPVSDEYNRAVTVALGRDLDAVVVTDDATAFKCMDYLKRQRAGIATFLPLSSLRVQPPSDHFRRLLDPTMKLVFDVITFAEVDKKAVMYACGNALVARDMDEARRFQFGGGSARLRRSLAEAKANDGGNGGGGDDGDDDDDDDGAGAGAGGQQRFKVVTLDGSVLHRSGNMTGGARAAGGNDRFTESAVAKLREETQTLVEELARLTSVSGAAAGDARGRLQHRVSALQTKLSVAQDEAARLAGEIAIYEQRVATLETELNTRKRPEAAAARAAQAAVEEKLARAEKDATAVETQRFAPFLKAQRAASLKAWEEEKLGAAAARRERLGKFQVQVSRLEAQLAYEQSRLAEDAGPQASLQKRSAAAKADLAAALKALSKLDISITEHEAAIQALEGAFRGAEAAVAEELAAFKAARGALEAAEAAVAGERKEILLAGLRMAKTVAERGELLRKAVMEQIALPLARPPPSKKAGGGRKGKGHKRGGGGVGSPSKRARMAPGAGGSDDDYDYDEEEESEGESDQSLSQSFPLSLSEALGSSSSSDSGAPSSSQPETELGSALAGTRGGAHETVLIDYATLPVESAISGLQTEAEVEDLKGKYLVRHIVTCAKHVKLSDISRYACGFNGNRFNSKTSMR